MRCPVCTGPLALTARSPRVLGCPAGHRFDVARQGHVVLVAGGSKLRADTADMVAARQRVHASGAFDGVRDALTGAVLTGAVLTGAVLTGVVSPAGRSDLVLDLAAGPGTWAAALLDALPDHRGLALELSVPALRAAARAHPRLAAVGSDLTRPLPLVDGAVGPAGVVLGVFAPLPHAAELRRVAAPGALLVVVTPTPDHLAGLRERLDLLDVPAGKPERLDDRLADGWDPAGRRQSVRQVRLTRGLAADVVAMGPNAWHADDRLRAALTDLPDEVEDTVAVTVGTYRRGG